MNSQPDNGRSSTTAGRRRPKVSKGDLREQALLDAAEDALHDTALADLTMDAIASKAGITRSSAYFYFASKEDIVHAVIARATGHLYTGIETAHLTEVATALDQAVAALFDNWRRYGHIFRVAVELAVRPPYRRTWKQLMDHGRDLACQAVAHDRSRGLVAGDPAEDLALIDAVAWMCERNCYLLFTRDHTPAEEEQLRSTLSAIAHRSLRYIAH